MTKGVGRECRFCSDCLRSGREDTVVLVEQVRIGAYQPESARSPWLLEFVAGMVEEGNNLEEVALREEEEQVYRSRSLIV